MAAIASYEVHILSWTVVALLILATTTPSSQTPGFSLKLLPTYSPEPWKNLTLEERHQRIAKLSVKHAHGLGSISSVAAINSSNKVKSYQDCPSGDFYVVIVENLAIGTPHFRPIWFWTGAVDTYRDRKEQWNSIFNGSMVGFL